jgi:methylthioribose-1-phosphate isomerase
VREGIKTTVITESMAGPLMRAGDIDLVVVGADRIAANGDTANKIGTYTVAVLAHEHKVPFYVAAPLSTIDLATPDGDHIPIEERDQREVSHLGAARLTPVGALIRNPAFDVTPSRYITGIITERGIFRPPYTESLQRAFQASVVIP